MLECEIPCVHTITQNSQITITLPKLDENQFLNDVDFKPVKSPLTGSLKFTNKDIDINDSKEYITFEEITEAIQRNREFLQYFLFERKTFNNFKIILKNRTRSDRIEEIEPNIDR